MQICDLNRFKDTPCVPVVKNYFEPVQVRAEIKDLRPNL